MYFARAGFWLVLNFILFSGDNIDRDFLFIKKMIQIRTVTVMAIIHAILRRKFSLEFKLRIDS